MEFIMENQYLKATVTTWGAQLKSVVRKSDGVEHMWRADPAVWGYHAPTMFPYCDRVPDSTIVVDGKSYVAPCHGFAQGMERQAVRHSDTSVVLELTDTPETLAQWPFRFRLTSTFTLENDIIRHTLTVENRDSREMPFGIGFHPGFALPFDDKHTYADYELRFSSLETPLCIGFPNGRTGGRLYTLGTNIRSLPIDETVFQGPSLCMANLASRYISLYEKDTGRRVTCDIQGFPYCLVWNRGGDDPQFVCIEPWHSIPNPIDNSNDWSKKQAAEILSPGQTWSTTLSMEFAR